MSFICALSNEPAEQPVVSPVSGNIFERRLICKYIAETGADPTNGRILSQEMLIDLKVPSTLKPKPPTATSIPGLLKALQDEWDAVMLHSFTLRQQLQAARQELSHALYQHDAACRVIARLTKEVTAAREALATLKPQAGIITSVQAPLPVVSEPAIVVEETIPPEVISKLEEKASVLTQQRKQRGKKIPDDLASADTIRSFHCTSSHVGLHSVSVPGILTMDICAHDSNKILTGGNDKMGVVFNKESEQVVAILRGHTKKITKAIYHNTEDIAITTSPDCSIRVWHIPTAQCSQLIRAHNAAVTGLSLHPTGDYILTCSADEHWSFCDIRTGKIFAKVSDQSSNQQPLTCAQFHPDGLIFGIGTADSMIKIWDLKERTNVANFPGHSGQVSAIAFSENGYYLATSADDAVVKIWDLRKLKNIKSIILDEKYEIKDLAFDQSGVYLAVAGSDVRIYQVKQWDTLRTFNDHTALATGVRFGAHANFLVSCSMDRSIKFFSV